MEQKAQQLKMQGLDAFYARDYTKAITLLHEAVADFSQSGDEGGAAEAANNLSVVALQAGDARAALEAADGTDQVFARLGDIHRQATALGNQAAAIEALGNAREAAQKYEQSARLFEQVGNNENRAVVLQALSQLQFKNGAVFDSMISMHDALRSKKKLNLIERILRSLLRIVARLMNKG